MLPPEAVQRENRPYLLGKTRGSEKEKEGERERKEGQNTSKEKSGAVYWCVLLGIVAI